MAFLSYRVNTINSSLKEICFTQPVTTKTKELYVLYVMLGNNFNVVRLVTKWFLQRTEEGHPPPPPPHAYSILTSNARYIMFTASTGIGRGNA